MVNNEQLQGGEDRRALAKKIEKGGWGIFFIWVGIAWLANAGWGVGLLGVGVIALGGQAARQLLGLRVEAFGVIFGMLLVLCGIWELLHLNEAAIPGGLAAVFCFALGVVFLVSTFLPKARGQTRGHSSAGGPGRR